MSLLWPEHIVVGLFPGFCWLRRGKSVSVIELADDAQADDLLAAFNRLLHMPGRSARRARIEVLVSDHFARMVTIPWQPGLAGRRLIQAYGVACLSSAGLVDGDDWVIEAGFRHPGASGLAYALPRGWLAKIVAYAEASGAVVSTVIPASAAAYWYHQVDRVHALSSLLMIESARISALVFHRGRFAGLDVEPIVGGLESSLARLAARTRATRGKVGQIAFWSARTDDGSSVMEAAFFAVKRTPIRGSHWSAHG